VNRLLDVATAAAATATRAGLGARVGRLGRRPQQPVVLYEFEACPFCRKVREALSVLDLDAEIRPCPKGGTRFREEVRRRGGKAQFPYLIDPNTGREMYESDAIVAYLHREYGAGPAPLLLRAGWLGDAGAMLASAWRPTRGSRYRAARAPEAPLELWSFEASPACRRVREALSSLELPYHLHNVAAGSGKREALVSRSGGVRVPYLVDPNTGVTTLGAREIEGYLERAYARGEDA
jgi:glutathione S-transferase